MSFQIQKAINIVQRTCVKDQVASSKVDVRWTTNAKKHVRKRVFMLAFVKLDLLLVHVNVVSHAFFKLFSSASCKNLPIEFHKLDNTPQVVAGIAKNNLMFRNMRFFL